MNELETSLNLILALVAGQGGIVYIISWLKDALNAKDTWAWILTMIILALYTAITTVTTGLIDPKSVTSLSDGIIAFLTVLVASQAHYSSLKREGKL